MKFYCIALLIFTLIGGIQNNAFGQNIGLGLKGGIHASFIQDGYIFSDEDVLLDLDPKLSTRFSVGGVVRYNITPHFSIQSEVLYTTRGARFNENVDIRGQELRLNGDLTLTYIEVPLLFRVSTVLPERGPLFYQKPGFTFNAYTGGTFSYKTNAKFSGDIRGDIFGIDFNENFENRVWDQFTDTDFSLIIGAGFEYGVQTVFTFEIRYIHSLKDIGNDPQFDRDIRNGQVSVMMGVMF